MDAAEFSCCHTALNCVGLLCLAAQLASGILNFTPFSDHSNCARYSVLISRLYCTLLPQGGVDSDVKALVGLLSPASRLMQAVHSADADTLIKFMFPPERLPTHTQLMLVAESGR